jgi:PAS domain-containing protein
LTSVEAGEVLGLPPDVIRALADAGYLRSATDVGSPRFALGELKAFQARSLDDGTGGPVVAAGSLDPDTLLLALEGRSEEMADRALRLFTTVFPDAGTYTERQRERFLAEAKERFAAILAVCARGIEGAGELLEDLSLIGADAAHAGVPLLGMLGMLRVSRDLVVQTAVELAEAEGRHFGLALAIVLTRALPAIDRLTDAVAKGYWEALLEIEAEGVERYVNVVERASDGVFEVDPDGCIRYANPALLALLQRPAGEVVGARFEDVFAPASGPAPAVGAELATVELAVAGTSCRVRLQQFERLRDGVIVGWDGVVLKRG